jgi:hypothetical protein
VGARPDVPALSALHTWGAMKKKEWIPAADGIYDEHIAELKKEGLI